MSIELIHTSMARGLDGESGYTVAGRTGGMPMAMSDALSRLSGLPPAWPEATQGEKTMHAFRRVPCAGQLIDVLSCISPSGMDYTGRANRISHHRVIDREAARRSDPAALLQEASLWRQEWVGAARELAGGEIKPSLTRDDAPLHTWEKVFADAGVAAGVLDAVLKSGIGLWLVVPAQSRRLRLAAEMMSLLPLEQRWQMTFATRPIALGSEASVRICFVDEREPELAAHDAQSARSSWILRVGSGALAAKPAGALAERARHGDGSWNGGGAIHGSAPGAAQESGERADGESGAVQWNAPSRLPAPRERELAAPGQPDAAPGARPDQKPAAPPVIEVRRVKEPSASGGAWKWFALALIGIAALAWLAVRNGAAS